MPHLYKSMLPLIGTVVGVGFFGLPYVFGQAGFLLAGLELVILVLVQVLFLHMYADLVLMHKDHGRFLHVIGGAFGPLGRALTTLSFFGSLWGAMLAYIVAGGAFLSFILRAWIPISSQWSSLLFGIVGGGLLFGGLFWINRLQSYVIPLFFGIIAILLAFAVPHMDWSVLTEVHAEHVALPVGVILFALSGISAIPEIRDILGKDRKFLRRIITVSLLLVGGMYLLFSGVIVGITGSATPPQAIEAFAGIAPWMVLLGSILGLCTVGTAFLNIGTSVMNTLIYDFRVRHIHAWALTLFVPAVLFLVGARDFVHVLGITGGVLGALMAILVIVVYEKARLSHNAPKRAFTISPVVSFLIFLTFFAVLVLTLRA